MSSISTIERGSDYDKRVANIVVLTESTRMVRMIHGRLDERKNNEESGHENNKDDSCFSTNSRYSLFFNVYTELVKMEFDFSWSYYAEVHR